MRLVVDEYLDDLKREHSENIQSAKVSKKKTEKKMRDNFRVLLKESLQNENFHAKSQ